MKYYLLPVLSFLFTVSANAAGKDSTVNYNLPDSVKAVQFMAEVSVKGYNKKRLCSVGIKTDAVSLSIERYYQWQLISFMPNSFPANIVTLGIGVRGSEDRKARYPHFYYELQPNEIYKLMISQATDSAGNFSLYSGYIFLPKENKWKLIGTLKIENRWNTLQQPAVIYKNRAKQDMGFTVGQVWMQRNNGSWKNMKNETLPNPTINLFGHIDSVQQRQIDMRIINDAITSGKTDVKENLESVYYKMMKEGTGRQVSVNDTVTVNYRLSLFNDTAVIQETKDKPATFPLKRLIRGWQIGVPLLKVGGKIKLAIPSDLAYSIRTRAADIPPNSILVFEIEVLDAKSPM